MLQLTDKSKCCGCAACAQRCPKQCISMWEDNEGFSYPIMDKESCIDCGLCEKVCPVINQNEPSKPEKVYAAINPDEKTRKESSSGGMFTMLAEKVLSEKGVVFGARFDDKWEVIHDYCETVEDLAKFRGSKYVQSKIGQCYKQAEIFLKDGRLVLFSGTSCQIAGLNKYLHKEYLNLLAVDVVCHGVPSPRVWREYIKKLKERPKGVAGKNTVLSSLNAKPVITGIAFRDKSIGWKKYGFVVRGHADLTEACGNSVLSSKDNEHIVFQEVHYENLFMEGFLKNIYLRPSCYACPAKSGKSGSDITLADYWGIGNHHPEMDDDKGTSLVLLKTSKGASRFAELGCIVAETTYAEALAGNPSIEKSVAMPSRRHRIMAKLEKSGVGILPKELAKMQPSSFIRGWRRLKRIIKKLLK